MNDDIDRLSDVLDDLIADREPTSRDRLSTSELKLAETAASLRAAKPERLSPRDEFVEALAARIASERSDAQPIAPEARSPGGLTRRSAIWRAAAAVAGVAASGAGLAGAYEFGKTRNTPQDAESELTAPMVPDDRGGWQHTGYHVSQVAEGSAVRFRAGAVEGFLVNAGPAHELYALSATCTHMGCMLTWMDGAETFLCPCHGAQYNANGTVLSGIARHPLPRLRLKIQADGNVFVWSIDEHPAVTTVAPYNKA
jgi:cytochrome b6-f complex iron-sulfur subunit